MTTEPIVRPIASRAAAEAANRNAGLYWFTPDSMRFFDGRISDSSFTPVADGTLFVSSERNTGWPRYYTIRFIHNGAAGTRGSVDTVGKFQAYESLNGALGALKRRAAHWQGIEAELAR